MKVESNDNTDMYRSEIETEPVDGHQIEEERVRRDFEHAFLASRNLLMKVGIRPKSFQARY